MKGSCPEFGGTEENARVGASVDVFVRGLQS